ncbi:hypothetical protein DPMN_104311 [Dreissena polymorpha]|uniref:Uncharacterized protein n=1 Tax=Dreissena polymorpha TaxID=45954 RepID=A0A9D4K115_DREPO|nr:hypothetical protein DPMN_104311 [Dreissena polymorpha]
MDKELHKSLIEWKPINERLMSARFNSAYAKLTIVVCYAPTEVAEDTEKTPSTTNYMKSLNQHQNMIAFLS